MMSLPRYGSRVVALRLDVTRAEQVAEVARQVQDVDLLFNNAGVVEGTGLTNDAALDEARREMQVNYLGDAADGAALHGHAGAARWRHREHRLGGRAHHVPLMPTYSASK